jgi:two-component system sensor histidine kinase DegS
MKISNNKGGRAGSILKMLISRHFWIITGMLILCTILHYPQIVPFLNTLPITSFFGLERHAVERILFLLPVVYTAYVSGMKCGIICLIIVLAIMFPRVFFISQYPKDAFFETCIAGVIGTLINLWLESRRQQLRQQKQMEDKLRLYTDQISNAHEEERMRIARELHDDTVQVLIAMSIQLDNFLTKNRDIDEARLNAVREVQQRTDEAIIRMRRYIHFLRPPTLDYLGLLPALRELTGDVEKQTGIRIHLSLPDNLPALSRQKQLLIYRVVQEAVNNIWKHSDAKDARITFSLDDNMLNIVVHDNGKGFDVKKIPELLEKGKLGLMGMEERAHLLKGTLSITSEEGGGTTVTLAVPCQEPE